MSFLKSAWQRLLREFYHPYFNSYFKAAKDLKKAKKSKGMREPWVSSFDGRS